MGDKRAIRNQRFIEAVHKVDHTAAAAIKQSSTQNQLGSQVGGKKKTFFHNRFSGQRSQDLQIFIT